MPEEIAWRQKGLVLVGGAPEAPRPIRVHDLIACPTCRARMDECCRTPSGHTRTPHKNRLVGRYCPCGERVKHKRRYCDPCRDQIDQENRYAGVVRFRARSKGTG